MSTTLTLTDAQVTALAPLFAAIGVVVEPSAPADQAPAKPKAEPRYRTEKQIEAGHARYSALWTSLKKANPGVSSKDLAAAHKAELAACWPKGSRKTPVAKG